MHLERDGNCPGDRLVVPSGVGVGVGVLGQGIDAGACPGVALVHGSAQSQWGYPTQRRQCVSPSGGSVMGRAGLQGHDPRRKPM